MSLSENSAFLTAGNSTSTGVLGQLMPLTCRCGRFLHIVCVALLMQRTDTGLLEVPFKYSLSLDSRQVLIIIGIGHDTNTIQFEVTCDVNLWDCDDIAHAK